MGFDIRKNATGAITGALISYGKDLLAAIGPEIYEAFHEWNEQRKTPDGWTEYEYLTYLHGAIGDIKAKQIGPKWVDSVGDMALSALQMMVAKRRDKIGDAAQPTDPHPAPAPPPNKPYYGKLFVTRPSKSDPAYSVAEDAVWWNASASPDAVRFTLTPIAAAMAWPGWQPTSWAE